MTWIVCLDWDKTNSNWSDMRPWQIFHHDSNQWKFHLTLPLKLTSRSPSNFAHDTTAVLYWHMQNCVVIWSAMIELQWGKIFLRHGLQAKNSKMEPTWLKFSHRNLFVVFQNWLEFCSNESKYESQYKLNIAKLIKKLNTLWLILALM